MSQESFDWLQPPPMWVNGPARAHQPGFFRPQIVQFSDDNFIAAAIAATASPDPTGFRNAIATRADDPPIKLYQPAHGRFYLVTATLTCRIPGFPDREVRVADGEQVFFLLRRFAGGQEYGWVVNNGSKSWQPLTGTPRTVLDGEQQLPLTQMRDSNGRTVHVGYIPVAGRETYAVSADALNAALTPDEKAALAAKGKTSIDPRVEDFEARFSTPLGKPDTLTDPSPTVQAPSADISVFILLNTWEFFVTYLPDVAAALSSAPGAPQPTAAEAALIAVLRAQTLASGKDLATALGDIGRQAAALDQVGDAGPASLGFGASYDLRNATLNPAAVEAAVAAALPAGGAPSVMLPNQVAADFYAIRCVYMRPQCAQTIAAVSLPSPHFRFAAFFDADAPARPVRIVLPTDVSIAGMRKFNKGVSFIISDGLQKKLNRITGHETDLLQPSPSLGSEDGGLAWICSFSIQIIFIVAFILLLMFVIILNIVFWWIAFFRICLPLPKKFLPGG